MTKRLPDALRMLIAPAAVLPSLLPAEPMSLFAQWFAEAAAAGKQPNPNAMGLATIGGDGRPRSRIVLCRGIDVAAGYVVFYTNYEGAKGRELAADARASATFHWDHAERQVRMEGVVVRSPDAESDAYFARRPWVSRLSAWASRQSQPIASHEELEDQYAAAIERLGLTPEKLLAQGNVAVIPRPPYWGGFRLWAARVELWLGGGGRMHDRGVWERTLSSAGDGFSAGPWRATRLQP